MKSFYMLTAIAVCVALLLSLVSCVDLGVGETEDAFKEYFSSVSVLSQKGKKQYSIRDFNQDISIEDVEIPIVVPHEKYCYIGFEVDAQYTISLSEFAFFAKTESGSGNLELEFYIVDKMPSSIKNELGEDVDLPSLDGDDAQSSEESTQEEDEQTESEGETETEVYEDDLFDPSQSFHIAIFSVSEEWSSVLLQFDSAKTVEPGQYVVVRINNNCYSSTADGEEERTPSVSFTFNYLLFHFTDAHKE